MVKIPCFFNGNFYYFHKSKGRVFDRWKFKVWTLAFKIIYADHTEKRLAHAINRGRSLLNAYYLGEYFLCFDIASDFNQQW